MPDLNLSEDLLDASNFLSNLDSIIPESNKTSGVTLGMDMLNPSGFSDIEDDDKTKDIPELYYKRATTRAILKNSYQLALGIDPSQHGSGFAIYDNRGINGSKPILHLESSSLSKIKDTKEDPLNYFKMQSEFASDLLDAVKLHIDDPSKVTFDIIIIEDTVFSNGDPQTFKRLVLINHVIDHLITQKAINTKRFVRVNNKVWKKFLFSYKSGKQYMNVKREIEETLLYLKEPFVMENYNQTKKWKDKTHYQDKLDALAMLVVGNDVAEYYESQVTKAKKVSYKLKLTTSEPKNSTLVELPNTHQKTLRDAISSIKSEPVKHRYHIPVVRGQIGSWGIKQDLIFPLGIEEAYLVLY